MPEGIAQLANPWWHLWWQLPRRVSHARTTWRGASERNLPRSSNICCGSLPPCVPSRRLRQSGQRMPPSAAPPFLRDGENRVSALLLAGEPRTLRSLYANSFVSKFTLHYPRTPWQHLHTYASVRSSIRLVTTSVAPARCSVLRDAGTLRQGNHGESDRGDTPHSETRSDPNSSRAREISPALIRVCSGRLVPAKW